MCGKLTMFDVTHPVILRPHKGRYIGLFLMTSGVLALWLIFTLPRMQQAPWLGWLMYCLFTFMFALGPITALRILMPNSMYLRLSTDGLEVCHFSTSRVYRWSDISKFWGNRDNRFVLISFSPSFLGAKASGFSRRALEDADGGVDARTYGFTGNELAEYLSEWKASVAAAGAYQDEQRASTDPPPQGSPE